MSIVRWYAGIQQWDVWLNLSVILAGVQSLYINALAGLCSRGSRTIHTTGPSVWSACSSQCLRRSMGRLDWQPRRLQTLPHTRRTSKTQQRSLQRLSRLLSCWATGGLIKKYWEVLFFLFFFLSLHCSCFCNDLTIFMTVSWPMNSLQNCCVKTFLRTRSCCYS